MAVLSLRLNESISRKEKRGEKRKKEKKEEKKKPPRIPDFKDIWASLEVCLSEYIRVIACTQSSAEQKANRGDLILSRTRSFPWLPTAWSGGGPAIRSAKGWTVLPLSEKQKVLPEYGSANCSGCAAVYCPHLNQVGICKFPYLMSQTATQVFSSGKSLACVGLPHLYSSLLRTVTLKAICFCSPLLQHCKKFWWKPTPRQRLHKCWNTGDKANTSQVLQIHEL